MSWFTYDDKLLETYKTIWTKIDDWKSIELDALSVYDDSTTIKFILIFEV